MRTRTIDLWSLAYSTILLLALSQSPAVASNQPMVEVNYRNIPDHLESAFNNPTGRLVNRLETFPRYPSTNEFLQCKLYASIALSGQVLSTEVEESSGDPSFDGAALFALRNIGNLGGFPNLGPRILLADIKVTNKGQRAVALKQIELESDNGFDTLATAAKQQVRTEKSDWIEDERLDDQSHFYDHRPWKPVKNHISSTPAQQVDSSPSYSSNSELQGFKLLNPFQLKFIPDNQKTSYMAKLKQWFNLPPEEKFSL